VKVAAITESLINAENPGVVAMFRDFQNFDFIFYSNGKRDLAMNRMVSRSSYFFDIPVIAYSK
jgi:hypothetical protein